MASLKARIGRLKALGLVKASDMGGPGPAREGSEPGRPGFPDGVDDRDQAETSACVGKAGDEPLPGWIPLGQGAFARTIRTGLVLSESHAGVFRPSDFERAKNRIPGTSELFRDVGELAFFDLETTGLSGGAGTLAFLAALGCFEGRDFLLTQIFIEDYPGEGVFLKTLASFFASHPWAVTYNGAAFDIPLIRTRFVMNGASMPELCHTDVLKPARRLWKRSIGPCSLKAVESAVLGFEREDDVPGFLIPRIWLEYSAGGRRRTKEGFESLLKVFEHNAQDVVSLARLFLRIEAIMARPLAAAPESHVHAPSLALELIGRDRREEALELLEAAGADGSQGSLQLLAAIYRRSARWAEYRSVVEAMDPGTLSGCLAKAKLAEHRSGDYGEALSWAEKAIRIVQDSRGRLPAERFDAQVNALLRRIARLQFKLRREAGKECGRGSGRP